MNLFSSKILANILSSSHERKYKRHIEISTFYGNNILYKRDGRNQSYNILRD